MGRHYPIFAPARPLASKCEISKENQRLAVLSGGKGVAS
jgi:hypothetical protein